MLSHNNTFSNTFENRTDAYMTFFALYSTSSNSIVEQGVNKQDYGKGEIFSTSGPRSLTLTFLEATATACAVLDDLPSSSEIALLETAGEAVVRTSGSGAVVRLRRSPEGIATSTSRVWSSWCWRSASS